MQICLKGGCFALYTLPFALHRVVSIGTVTRIVGTSAFFLICKQHKHSTSKRLALHQNKTLLIEFTGIEKKQPTHGCVALKYNLCAEEDVVC